MENVYSKKFGSHVWFSQMNVWFIFYIYLLKQTAYRMKTCCFRNIFFFSKSIVLMFGCTVCLNSVCSKTKIIEIVEAKRDLIKHSIHWKITHRCCTGVFTLLYFVSIKQKINSKTKKNFYVKSSEMNFSTKYRQKNVHFIVICCTELARQDIDEKKRKKNLFKEVVKPVCKLHTWYIRFGSRLWCCVYTKYFPMGNHWMNIELVVES